MLMPYRHTAADGCAVAVWNEQGCWLRYTADGVERTVDVGKFASLENLKAACRERGLKLSAIRKHW
jgi:hypothetical protein